LNSSRSHTIFNIYLKTLNNDDISVLSIIDLAGSEKLRKAETSGKGLKETCKINSSLFTLKACFEAIKHNNNLIDVRNLKNEFINGKLTGINYSKTKYQIKGIVPVPFRESKLTMIIHDYLSNEDANIVLISHLNLEKEHEEDNIRVLGYSDLTKCIKKEVIKSKVGTTNEIFNKIIHQRKLKLNNDINISDINSNSNNSNISYANSVDNNDSNVNINTKSLIDENFNIKTINFRLISAYESLKEKYEYLKELSQDQKRVIDFWKDNEHYYRLGVIKDYLFYKNIDYNKQLSIGLNDNKKSSFEKVIGILKNNIGSEKFDFDKINESCNRNDLVNPIALLNETYNISSCINVNIVSNINKNHESININKEQELTIHKQEPGNFVLNNQLVKNEYFCINKEKYNQDLENDNHKLKFNVNNDEIVNNISNITKEEKEFQVSTFVENTSIENGDSNIRYKKNKKKKKNNLTISENDDKVVDNKSNENSVNDSSLRSISKSKKTNKSKKHQNLKSVKSVKEEVLFDVEETEKENENDNNNTLFLEAQIDLKSDQKKKRKNNKNNKSKNKNLHNSKDIQLSVNSEVCTVDDKDNNKEKDKIDEINHNKSEIDEKSEGDYYFKQYIKENKQRKKKNKK
jgi:hypothetical protein